MFAPSRTHQIRRHRVVIGLVLGLMSAVFPAWSQDFTIDSGSDGSDGVLNITDSGTVVFDPASFTPPLDVDGDGIYHFTTVTIGPDTTLRLRADLLGTRPVVFLATGKVQIDGVLNLNGSTGHDFGAPMADFSVAGAGGYSGGAGSRSPTPPYPGNGPGGGIIATDSGRGGGGGGHAFNGSKGFGSSGGLGGRAYGNHYLLPLLGGSGGGGGGGGSNNGGGGGAGGGALLIVSEEEIELNGTIRAEGGTGGTASGTTRGGGGGSGGAIRLVTPVLSGSGSLLARGGGGSNGGGSGALGRIRLESFQNNYGGSSNPNPRFSTPGRLSFPAPIRVTAIAGVPVPAEPDGEFSPADVDITVVGQTTIELEATGVPPGTVLDLTMFSETGGTITFQSTPLAGSLTLSNATATVTIPAGFSRIFVEGSWTP